MHAAANWQLAPDRIRRSRRRVIPPAQQIVRCGGSFFDIKCYDGHVFPFQSCTLSNSPANPESAEPLSSRIFSRARPAPAHRLRLQARSRFSPPPYPTFVPPGVCVWRTEICFPVWRRFLTPPRGGTGGVTHTQTSRSNFVQLLRNRPCYPHAFGGDESASCQPRAPANSSALAHADAAGVRLGDDHILRLRARRKRMLPLQTLRASTDAVHPCLPSPRRFSVGGRPLRGSFLRANGSRVGSAARHSGNPHRTPNESIGWEMNARQSPCDCAHRRPLHAKRIAMIRSAARLCAVPPAPRSSVDRSDVLLLWGMMHKHDRGSQQSKGGARRWC